MCGIAGIIYKDKSDIKDIVQVKKMTDTIRHRGPDAEGQWIYKNVAIGHRRLSIIDRAEISNQPMLSHDGSYILTYNGEIYNYLEIREELLREGALFRTNSDTEVIIEAYRKYGMQCFERFNGMWALCLYDIEQKKLILCRDRFGIKPLVYLENDNYFAFASEAKAILAAFPEENIPDFSTVYRFLKGVSAEETQTSFYKNIKIFPTASYMIYDIATNQKEFQRYWEIDEKQFYKKWIEGKNPYKTFRYLFEDAVRLRLQADVEVGACLSGGLDSSTIVGVASKMKKGIRTFSSIYKQKECNEEKYIYCVNNANQTNPCYVENTEIADCFEDYVSKMNYHYDGPTMDATKYSSFRVMEKAGKHVRVLLDGQGADELFAGYDETNFTNYLIDLFKKKGIFSWIEKINLMSIIGEHPNMNILCQNVCDVISVVGIDNYKYLAKTNKSKTQIPINSIFTQQFLESTPDNYKREEMQMSSSMSMLQYYAIKFFPLPEILHNEDSDSMAFSIETRLPFMDYRVVEFAIGLPSRYKVRRQWSKWIIRKGCKRYLPGAIANRKNKMGFPAPFARWLREDGEMKKIKNIIFDFGKRNIISVDMIERLYREHMSGEVDNSDLLYRIYSTEIWLRTCKET